MLPREHLPQIAREQLPNFARYCKEQGVPWRIQVVPVMQLKPLQKHLNVDKVKQMLKGHIETPLLISQEGYIVDGHHRWAAEAVRSRQNKMPCVVFECPVAQLVELGLAFDGSTTKSIYELHKQQFRNYL